jgi:hypothetical protein
MNAYSITAPEEIAKKYGGNKKKIQQAAAQGLINPTEAVMAGMFIDRMRNAAAQEQAQQPTVAEQVMNPQPQMPPQGMAATPQAQQMAQRPPQMGMPNKLHNKCHHRVWLWAAVLILLTTLKVIMHRVVSLALHRVALCLNSSYWDN